MAYVSPIDRMAAIAGAAQSIDQSNAYRDQMPLQQRLAQLRVSGAEGELHSMQQRQGMLDKQLQETDLGARAYSLAQMDDATLMQELPRQMPQFYEAGKFEGATPDQYRQRLGGIANYAASKGYIQIPQQAKERVSLQSKAVQLADGSRAFAGYDPSTNTYFEQGTNRPYGPGEIAPIETSGQTINIGGEKQTVFQKKLEEKQADQMANIQNQAQEAVSQDFQLAQLEDLLDQGIPTGQLAGRLVGLKGLAADLGIDVGDSLQAQEAYRKITNQMALRLRNPESGMGLTGNTSDRDLTFLKQSVPALESSEAGNRLIIDMMRRVNLRKREVAILAEKYAMKNGNLSGFSEELSKWADSNSMFDDEFRKKVDSVSSEAPSQKPGGVQEGATATNPSTGERVVFRNGSWEPLK